MIRRKIKIVLSVKLKKRECPKRQISQRNSSSQKNKVYLIIQRSILDSFSGVLEEKNKNGFKAVKGISMKKRGWLLLRVCQKRGKNGNWNTLNISSIFSVKRTDHVQRPREKWQSRAQVIRYIHLSEALINVTETLEFSWSFIFT